MRHWWKKQILTQILQGVNDKFNQVREFIHTNNGIFTFSFIVIFFMEQLLLMYVVYAFLKVSATAQFFIGTYALLVLTTATIEKFILEKKYQYQKKEIDIISFKNEEMLTEMKDLSRDYERLYTKYQQLKKKR